MPATIEVTVIDRNAEALAKLASEGIATRVVETADSHALAAALEGKEAVVNALPYHLAVNAARAAVAAGCHYFDLTEDVAATRDDQAARRRREHGVHAAVRPRAGLHRHRRAPPGARRSTSCDDVKMRVGALPAFPTNALKYNLTWSVDGLINEYCHPCEAIHDGKHIEVLPLEGLEHFSLDGTEYEAFNTSGGLGHAVRDARPARCAPSTTRPCATPATATS